MPSGRSPSVVTVAVLIAAYVCAYRLEFEINTGCAVLDAARPRADALRAAAGDGSVRGRRLDRAGMPDRRRPRAHAPGANPASGRQQRLALDRTGDRAWRRRRGPPELPSGRSTCSRCWRSSPSTSRLPPFVRGGVRDRATDPAPPDGVGLPDRRRSRARGARDRVRGGRVAARRRAGPAADRAPGVLLPRAAGADRLELELATPIAAPCSCSVTWSRQTTTTPARTAGTSSNCRSRSRTTSASPPRAARHGVRRPSARRRQGPDPERDHQRRGS